MSVCGSASERLGPPERPLVPEAADADTQRGLGPAAACARALGSANKLVNVFEVPEDLAAETAGCACCATSLILIKFRSVVFNINGDEYATNLRTEACPKSANSSTVLQLAVYRCFGAAIVLLPPST